MAEKDIATEELGTAEEVKENEEKVEPQDVDASVEKVIDALNDNDNEEEVKQSPQLEKEEQIIEKILQDESFNSSPEPIIITQANAPQNDDDREEKLCSSPMI